MKPDQLNPEDMFYLQVEAFRSGDFKAVKEMSEIARTRIRTVPVGDWSDAKDNLDAMKFPEGGFYELHENISHDKGKDSHAMKNYKKRIVVDGYIGEAKYSMCPKCKQIRNKVLRIYKDGICYEKWFIFRGEEVKGRDLSDIADDLFAN